MNKSNLYDEIKHREIVPVSVHIYNIFLTKGIVTSLRRREINRGVILNGTIYHSPHDKSMMLNYYFIFEKT